MRATRKSKKIRFNHYKAAKAAIGILSAMLILFVIGLILTSIEPRMAMPAVVVLIITVWFYIIEGFSDEA